jgi:hypothetical protein
MIFRGMETMPGWLVTFLRQLREGGAQAPPEALPPVAMLGELLAITGAMISGRGAPQTADQVSLQQDIFKSFDCLGPSSLSLLRTSINDFRPQVGRLPKLFENVAGAHVLRAGAEVLLGELTCNQSRICAFDDCIEAFRSHAFVGACETRLRHLRSVLEAGGHDWADRERHLHEALAGSYDALRAHGALNPHPSDPPFLEDAGLTIDERVCLARAVLRAQPMRGRVIVWLAYSNAFIRGFYLKKGPVEFYDSRIWPSVLTGTENPAWQLPAELAECDADSFHGLPDQDFVMVRVCLDDVLIAQARERGRDLALAALELIGWDSDWVLMTGEGTYVPGGFLSAWFSDPREWALRSRGHPMLDPAGQVLAELSSDVLEKIAEADRPALDLLSDTRWRHAVASLPDAEQRVALVVALFERVLVPSAIGTERWFGACQRYFEFLLAFDDVNRQVWDAGYYGVHKLSHDTSKRDEFLSFDRSIVARTGPHSVNVRREEVIRNAGALRNQLEAGSMEARMLAEVEKMTLDGATAAQWLNASLDRFNRLLARARRQRNAVAHGTRTNTVVIESVEPFLNTLAGRLIGSLHYCVAEQRDLTTVLEGWRLVRLKRRDALLEGGSPELLVGL